MREIDEVFKKENGFYEIIEEAKGYLDKYIVEAYGKDVEDFYSIPARVRAFVQSVESDILEPFGISHSDNSVYNSIREFNQTLSDLFAPSPALSKSGRTSLEFRYLLAYGSEKRSPRIARRDYL